MKKMIFILMNFIIFSISYNEEKEDVNKMYEVYKNPLVNFVLISEEENNNSILKTINNYSMSRKNYTTNILNNVVKKDIVNNLLLEIDYRIRDIFRPYVDQFYSYVINKVTDSIDMHLTKIHYVTETYAFVWIEGSHYDFDDLISSYQPIFNDKFNKLKELEFNNIKIENIDGELAELTNDLESIKVNKKRDQQLILIHQDENKQWNILEIK